MAMKLKNSSPYLLTVKEIEAIIKKERRHIERLNDRAADIAAEISAANKTIRVWEDAIKERKGE